MIDPNSHDETTDSPPEAAMPASEAPTLSVNVEAGPGEPATLVPATAQSEVLDSHVTEVQHSEPSVKPAPAPRGEGIGSVIAQRYTLKEIIGEGGMGSVYLAHQTEPIKRDVALKLIKVGMDSRSVLARFNAERQALALMDHPNIARVYDGGTTPSGQPFFVMELVHGVPITDYCDEHRLTPQARLELFVGVCHAVQHAHQKGIIHRDLKPSNILVTEVDGRPTPKVIDFGVAKATEQRLLDQSLADTGAIVGTPIYMSPEQADPTSMDIDTRTDVYALGVVLYELLTGSPPIDAKQFKRGAILEMLRMVREVEPPRPSTKLSTADGLPNIAANRNMEPGKLARLLRGELDWVVMKALEKDRTRRYDSANGFASDLQRYLADEVVEARPPSRAYRFRKFVRRNKIQVTAATVVLLALIGGIIGTTMGLIQAREARQAESQQRQIAEKNEQDAKDERNKAIELQHAEEKARIAAERAQEVTAAQRKLALDTVRDVLIRVDEIMKNDAKLAPLRIQIIKRMIEDVDRIRDHAIKNPLEDRTEATAYSRLGDVYFKSNRSQDAVEWLRKSHAMLKFMLDEAPNDLSAIRSYAYICTALANAEWRVGRGIRSRDLHAEALRYRLQHRSLLSKSAEEIEQFSSEMDIAESFMNIAYDELRLGNPTQAVANYTSAEARYAALGPPLGNTLRVRRIRAEIQVRLGDARARLNQVVEAEKHFNDALRTREELARMMVRPQRTAELIKTDIGQSRMYLGDFNLMIKKDLPAARKEYQACHDIFLEQIKTDPDNLDLVQRLGASNYRLGLVTEDAAKAKTYYEESLKYREQLARIDARDLTAQVEYLLSLARLKKYDDVDRLASRIIDQAPMDPQSLFQTACGYAILSQGSTKEADAFRQRTLNVIKRLLEAGWKDPVGLQTDPDFQYIRDDPRFMAFLKIKS